MGGNFFAIVKCERMLLSEGRKECKIIPKEKTGSTDCEKEKNYGKQIRFKHSFLPWS